MSIISALLHRSRLPDLDDVMEELLSYAKSLRRGSKFQVGEDLPKGSFILVLRSSKLENRAFSIALQASWADVSEEDRRRLFRDSRDKETRSGRKIVGTF